MPAELLSGDTISIHALRVEGDCVFAALPRQPVLFLSTPSGWRATVYSMTDFPPEAISIHALRVEGDRWAFRAYFPRRLFLSTPSGWRATTHIRL